MPKAHASGEASPCAEGPSRRLVVGTAAASPLLGIGAADPAIAACETFLSRQSEQQRLGRRWQEIESRAFVELD